MYLGAILGGVSRQLYFFVYKTQKRELTAQSVSSLFISKLILFIIYFWEHVYCYKLRRIEYARDHIS